MKPTDVKGDIYLQTGKPEQAIKMYEEAICWFAKDGNIKSQALAYESKANKLHPGYLEVTVDNWLELLKKKMAVLDWKTVKNECFTFY
ncbi:MAG: tetratricopeptide repeat protein [Acidobacteria bacterium]|nr:tetratricopeptide repeat protein [Acidobacteriota bacterium]